MSEREPQIPATGRPLTDAVHAGAPKQRPHHAIVGEIAQTATFVFEDTADVIRYMEGNDPDADREEYGRYGNPTVRELERRIAALEGAADCVALSSGMAAVTSTILALVSAGDHVVLFNDCYRRTRQFVMNTLSRFGIEHTIVPPGDLKALGESLKPNTRLVITEAPTNPYLYCLDLDELVQVVKGYSKRIRTMVDSTFATPINFQPLKHGVDLSVHSATKYLAGHNDVLGGVVSGPQHLISLVRDFRGIAGAILDPHAAMLITRGVKTLGLRVAQQNTSGLHLATVLENHPAVHRVYYPLLPSHPNFPVASRLLSGGGGVISFSVHGGRAAAARVIDRVRIPRIAPSFGGVESLIEQPCYISYFEFSDEDLMETVGIDPGLIRFSVGIEDVESLEADLLQALDQEKP